MFEDFSTTDLVIAPRVINTLDALPALTDYDLFWVYCHRSVWRMMEFTSLLLCYQDAGVPVDQSILSTYQFSGRG